MLPTNILKQEEGKLMKSSSFGLNLSQLVLPVCPGEGILTTEKLAESHEIGKTQVPGDATIPGRLFRITLVF